jgi:hypothetical protein
VLSQSSFLGSGIGGVWNVVKGVFSQS